MKRGRALGVAVLLWAVQSLGVFAASVPVFHHDPVQEKAYFHQEVLPQLIPLAIIALLAVILIAAAVHKARRNAKNPDV